MKRNSWMFLAFAGLVAAGCLRLGFWQLARLEDRRARNTELQAGLDQPPADFGELLEAGTPPTFRRVRVEGRLDAEHEIVLTGHSLHGQAGFHLVTPLRLTGRDQAVLVDRGWIPAADRELPERDKYAREGTVTIQGVTKPSTSAPSLFFLAERPTPSLNDPDLDWRTVDVPAIQSQVPYPLVDVYVAAVEPVVEGEPAPVPQPNLDLSEGPHLGYAIQWFSFAAIALVGGSYWVWQRRRPAEDDAGSR